LKPWVYVGYNGGKIALWDTEKNSLVTTWQVPGAGDISAIGVGGQFDKRLIAAGDRTGKVFFGTFDANGTAANFTAAADGMKGEVTGIDVSSFGDMAVAGAASAEVRVWAFSNSFNPAAPVYSRDAVPNRLSNEGDRRADLAVRDLVLLDDNSFVVARDADIELWNPQSMIPTSLVGSEGMINGRRIGRVTSIGAVGARSSNCDQAQAVIAAGVVAQNEEGGRVMFLHVPMVKGRWLPSAEDERLSSAIERFRRTNSSEAIVGVSGAPTGTVDATRMRPKLSVDCNGLDRQAEPSFETLASFIQQNRQIPWSIDPGNLRGVKGHSQRITDVSFSKDAQRVVTASMDGTIGIWDLQSKKTLRKLIVQRASISTAILGDKDGRVFFTQSGDGKLLSWDQEAMNTLVQVDKASGLAVAMSKDGKRFAYATQDNVLKLVQTHASGGWRVLPEVIAETKTASRITTIAFVPDDLVEVAQASIITARCDGEVSAWKINGKALTESVSHSVQNINDLLQGAVDNLAAAYSGECKPYEPSDRVVLGFGVQDGKAKLVASYPTTLSNGIIVFNLESMNPEVAYSYLGKDESFARSTLRPTQVLTKEGAEIVELRSMDDIAINKDSLSKPLIELYPVQFSRKRQTAVVMLSPLNPGQSPFVGNYGSVMALAVAPSSDLMVHGGRMGVLNVTRITDKSQSFVLPQDFQRKGAGIPGKAYDLAISKDGVAAMAAENGVFLAWASEIYTYSGF
jgi:WD40 repeat protein